MYNVLYYTTVVSLSRKDLFTKKETDSQSCQSKGCLFVRT